MHLRPFANAILAVCLSSCCNSAHAQAASPNEAPQPIPAAAAIPQLPTPSGPYGVGRVGYDWTDPSRPDRFSSALQALAS